ncbi:MAG: hypothetical protein WCX73_02965 [Candidatus Pacearchaeota archaeon]|jgi:hypothetical protein
MGIFDFFKAKKQEIEKNQEIVFKDLGEKIKDKNLEIERAEKEPKIQIKKELKELWAGLEQEQVLLKNIGLKDKKVPEKVILIVNENLIKFSEYLQALISKTKKAEFKSLDQTIREVNLIFQEFEGKSSKSFQKSTFLVGKELEAIRARITKFYRHFNKIVSESQEVLKEKEIVFSIEKKMKKFVEKEKNKEENTKEIKEIKEEIKNLKEKTLGLNEKIEEIKKSREYLEEAEKSEKIRVLKENLKIRVYELREIIDFKALTRVYHSLEDKMALIKEYRNNFNETLEKYDYEKLQGLVNIKEINQKLIIEKINEIEKIRSAIREIKIKEDITLKVFKEIESINRKIEDFHLSVLEREKRNKRLTEEEEDLKQEIKTESEKVGLLVNLKELSN